MYLVCKKTVLVLALMLWMGIIFWFSAKPAVESAEMSHTVGYIVGEIFIDEFAGWPAEKQQAFAEKIDYPIRKSAHAAEYAVLGLLILATMRCFFGYRYRIAIISWCFGVVYAISDEVHQLFVPGRSGQISDVILDSVGVAAGICLYLVIKFIFSKRKINIL